jgi:hypothetical protein
LERGGRGEVGLTGLMRRDVERVWEGERVVWLE